MDADTLEDDGDDDGDAGGDACGAGESLTRSAKRRRQRMRLKQLRRQGGPEDGAEPHAVPNGLPAGGAPAYSLPHQPTAHNRMFAPNGMPTAPPLGMPHGAFEMATNAHMVPAPYQHECYAVHSPVVSTPIPGGLMPYMAPPMHCQQPLQGQPPAVPPGSMAHYYATHQCHGAYGSRCP